MDPLAGLMGGASMMPQTGMQDQMPLGNDEQLLQLLMFLLAGQPGGPTTGMPPTGTPPSNMMDPMMALGGGMGSPMPSSPMPPGMGM